MREKKKITEEPEAALMEKEYIEKSEKQMAKWERKKKK